MYCGRKRVESRSFQSRRSSKMWLKIGILILPWILATTIMAKNLPLNTQSLLNSIQCKNPQIMTNLFGNQSNNNGRSKFPSKIESACNATYDTVSAMTSSQKMCLALYFNVQTLCKEGQNGLAYELKEVSIFKIV
jgi:hypothetical protein